MKQGESRTKVQTDNIHLSGGYQRAFANTTREKRCDETTTTLRVMEVDVEESAPRIHYEGRNINHTHYKGKQL